MPTAGARGSLLLLRHGETEWTRARRVIGRRPVCLSDVGRAQCRAVVPILQRLAPTRIVSSPLLRARETAELLAAALACPLTTDDDLRELDFGAWEGRAYEELLADPTYRAFSAAPHAVAPPGGELVARAQARGLEAVARALATPLSASVCVVAHGDLIRLLLAAFLRLDIAEFRRLRVDTCGLSAVDLRDDWAEVKFVNLLADPERIAQGVHWGR